MHPASALERFTLLKPALTVSKATTPCGTRNAVFRHSAAGPLAALAHYILVPYRNRHPLSGPLYRLVATARSRGYHSGWLSALAGPSNLMWKLVAALGGSSNRCSRGIPAAAPTAGLCGLLAAAPRLPKQSTWRYRLGGDDYCVDPSWQRSPPWAPRTHTLW